jgi:hypothetical protein
MGNSHYQFIPQIPILPFLLLRIESSALQAMPWTKYHLAVTKYQDWGNRWGEQPNLMHQRQKVG